MDSLNNGPDFDWVGSKTRYRTLLLHNLYSGGRKTSEEEVYFETESKTTNSDNDVLGEIGPFGIVPLGNRGRRDEGRHGRRAPVHRRLAPPSLSLAENTLAPIGNTLPTVLLCIVP